jgi:hypothetical protein
MDTKAPLLPLMALRSLFSPRLCMESFCLAKP